MTTLSPVADPVQEPKEAPQGDMRLFEVGGQAPNIVTIGFNGRVENAPKLVKGEQYTFTVTATIGEVSFVDKVDAEGFVEKSTRRQKATIDAVELVP